MPAVARPYGASSLRTWTTPAAQSLGAVPVPRSQFLSASAAESHGVQCSRPGPGGTPAARADDARQPRGRAPSQQWSPMVSSRLGACATPAAESHGTLQARAASCQQRSPQARQQQGPTGARQPSRPVHARPACPPAAAKPHGALQPPMTRAAPHQQRSPTARASRLGPSRPSRTPSQQRSPTAGASPHGPGRTSPATVRRGSPVW